MAKKPNLVFFLADEMRADALGQFGNEASITPNMDGMTDDGAVSFRNAYCQNPVCTPSRCSFLTGWYPHTKGHRTMHFLLEPNDPMLLKVLKDQGYHVLWIGRNDVIPADRDFTPYCHEFYPGSDRFNPKAPHKDPVKADPDNPIYSFQLGKLDKLNGFASMDWNCVNRAIEFLKSLPAESEEPFCLYISLSFPHPPYGCEDPWFSMIDRSKIRGIRPVPEDWSGKASMLKAIHDKQGLQKWDESRFVELRATYLAMVARFDHQFGMILNELKNKNFYDDTAVFLFSDHGDYAGDYGIAEKNQNTFENSLSNIPLIIKPQAGVKITPRISHALVELVDIPATVAELAGFELDYTQFGKSLVHLLAAEETHRDAVFCEGGRIHGETQAMELQHGPDSPYWPRLSTEHCEGPEHTKAVMVLSGSFKYIERLYEKSELYNLEEDPDELQNRIDDPQYAELIRSMRKRLLRFYMETTDFVPAKMDRRF